MIGNILFSVVLAFAVYYLAVFMGFISGELVWIGIITIRDSVKDTYTRLED